VSIAAPYGYHAIEAAVQRRGYAPVRGRGFFARYATDLVLLTQAIAINGFITEVLKASFRRPRPYTYLLPEEVDPDRREDLLRAQSSHGADWSFPSGHASSAFAASTAGATLLTLELLGRANWAIALAWVGGTGVAATTGVMRVLAGRHFPSDVVTSALIGAGIGAAVPLAHWRPPPAGDRVDVRDILQSWAVAPMGRRDMVGLHLGGPLP
jgi:membrane-associated phospholipid phosphatase